jgi:hypothetical protein
MAIPLPSVLLRLAKEPPFRLLTRTLLKHLAVSVKTRALWDLSRRPAYLLGLVTAAEQARSENVREISVIEFGVAGGEGLIALQSEAAAVQRETGVGIKVYGFDAGAHGLPAFVGDYRDHPDAWKPGDFAMDVPALRSRLAPSTTLILGNVRETVLTFFTDFDPPPIGFVSFDMDLYSSTRDALRLFCLPEKRMLRHVPLYFDDVASLFNHKFAGELLAIDEFNAGCRSVKIDKWHGVKKRRPFPERSFLERLYVAHDLGAISEATVGRDNVALPLRN